MSADGTLIIDVGGGSTELVLGAAGGVAWSRSLQAGCVRMTERFLGEDVIAQEALDAAAAAVGELLGVVPGEVIDATRRAIAVAGTATTLAAIAHGGYEADAVHGAHITREQVRDTQRHLAGLSLARRREVPGLEPARAPVIVAGLVVLGSVLDRFCLAGALVSERDILHGAALLAAAGALRV